MSGSPDPRTRSGSDDHGEGRRSAERSSLRRELLAILVLYAAAAVLPLVVGLLFGPTSP